MTLSRGQVRELGEWCDGDCKQLTSEFIAAATRETRRLMAATDVLVAYRGLCLPKEHSLLQHDAGDQIRLSQADGPSSWSTDVEVARRFAFPGDRRQRTPFGGIVVRTRLTRDQVVLDTARLPYHLRHFKDEREVIAQPGDFECLVHDVDRPVLEAPTPRAVAATAAPARPAMTPEEIRDMKRAAKRRKDEQARRDQLARFNALTAPLPSVPVGA